MTRETFSGSVLTIERAKKAVLHVDDPCFDDDRYNPDDFDTVIEDMDFTTILDRRDPANDNLLIRNCNFSYIQDNGIFLRNVTNVVIFQCAFIGMSNNAIKLSSLGNATDVVIDCNDFSDIEASGIISDRNETLGIDHPRLKIINNTFDNIGIEESPPFGHHPIYSQGTDAYIANNIITGFRHGNGISIRSSGVVRNNNISGFSDTDRPGIRYYSDHSTGGTDRLLIENNIIVDANNGIDLFAPTNLSDEDTPPPTHVVKSFIIRNNDVIAPVKISVDAAYNSAPYSVAYV